MYRSCYLGCSTCKKKRRKCDEEKPICDFCRRHNLSCEYTHQPRSNSTRTKQGIVRGGKSSHPTCSGDPPSLVAGHQSSTPRPPLSRSKDTVKQSGCVSPRFQRHPDVRSVSADPPGDLDYDMAAHDGRGTAANQDTREPYADTRKPNSVSSEERCTPNASGDQRHTSTDRQVTDGPMLPDSAPSDPPPGRSRGPPCEEAPQSGTLNVPEGLYSLPEHNDHLIEQRASYLLGYFVNLLLPALLPVKELKKPWSVICALICEAIDSNKMYRHCCLSVAAKHHKKYATALDGTLDTDAVHHLSMATSTMLVELRHGTNSPQVLETILCLIIFQRVVGDKDSKEDVVWHRHFEAVICLAQRLELLGSSPDTTLGIWRTPFNRALVAWIDILGATIRGTAPAFAQIYRENSLMHRSRSLGLKDVMGCNDIIMYYISDIACLDVGKHGMDSSAVRSQVSDLLGRISAIEENRAWAEAPSSVNGELPSSQPSNIISEAFCLAARIHVNSLLPEFSPHQLEVIELTDKLASVLERIPSGANFDRALTWVYLIGCATSLPGSELRLLFCERVSQLGGQPSCGSFKCLIAVLTEVWARNDELPQGVGSSSETCRTPPRYTHWRHVMQAKGWDFLLI